MGCVGDYTLRCHSYLSKYLSYFDGTKVQKKSDITKLFLLISFNELLKNPLFMGVCRGSNVTRKNFPCN